MCGIAGEIAFAARSDADWQNISNLMQRRGPDDHGAWNDQHCTMAFRRLSILDLSDKAHQPMLSADGNFALTFNGELYNFRELRRELAAAGAEFRSDGDSEVVLQALIHWGVEALSRFNGMFAIAFYARQSGRLLLARDHAGIKPLYYLHTGNGVVYASQYNQLLAHPWRRDCNTDPAAISLYLHLGFIPAPYAALQNTHMLEPGCWFEAASSGETRRGRYYSMAKFQPSTLSGDEAIEAVDAAISASVKRQLVSDVPVASFLSGGVDSPLVLAKMLTCGQEPVRAFTIGTEDSATDESSDASDYARQLGVQHTLEKISEADALALLDDVLIAASEPFGDYSLFPTMLVSRLAARDFKVILSGDGGDELFWGYVARMADGIKVAPDFRRHRLLRRIEWETRKLLGKDKGYFHIRSATLGDWHAWKHLLLRDNELPRVFPDLPAWPQDYDAFSFDGCGQDQAAQWMRWNEFTTHLTKVLLKVDRASMHQSLEVRVPLLDREVIDTAARVDWRSCLDMQQAVGKLPLRQLLARRVTRQSQSKRGFEVPMAHWLRHSLREVFHDAVLSRDELMGLPLNRSHLAGLFNRHVRGDTDIAQGLWPILSLALWERTHLQQS